MKRKDDFNPEVKRALAKRAGYHCSFPGCGIVTIGPSEESEIATIGSGMACHISSASAGPGARRYDPSMTSEHRQSIANGIWLCYTHGKIIDADESRYTVPQLRKWRELAEKRIQLYQTYGKKIPEGAGSLREIGLPNHTITLPGQLDENMAIGQALEDSRVGDIWGANIATAVRDFAIEIARNAFQHGRATHFTLEIEPDRLVMRDDGADFNPSSLVATTSESGGTLALQHLLQCFSDKLVIAFSRENTVNTVTIGIISHIYELFELTPCVIELTVKQTKEGSIPIQIHHSCRLIYVVLPKYLTISDSLIISEALQRPMKEEQRPLVFVLQGLSTKVREIVERRFPLASFLVLDSE